MEETMKARLSESSIWIRALYMLLFAIAWSIGEMLLAAIAIFQFVMVLITGSANEALLRFGRNLGAYFNQIAQFLTFNDDVRPYPFSDWPDEPVTTALWGPGGAPQDAPTEPPTSTAEDDSAGRPQP